MSRSAFWHLAFGGGREAASEPTGYLVGSVETRMGSSLRAPTECCVGSWLGLPHSRIGRSQDHHVLVAALLMVVLSEIPTSRFRSSILNPHDRSARIHSGNEVGFCRLCGFLQLGPCDELSGMLTSFLSLCLDTPVTRKTHK